MWIVVTGFAWSHMFYIDITWWVQYNITPLCNAINVYAFVHGFPQSTGRDLSTIWKPVVITNSIAFLNLTEILFIITWLWRFLCFYFFKSRLCLEPCCFKNHLHTSLFKERVSHLWKWGHGVSWKSFEINSVILSHKNSVCTLI